MGKAVSVEIAPARLEDVFGIVALEREIAQAPHWPEEFYRKITSSAGTSAQRRYLLAARVQGELAGFAVGRVLADEAELESVAVGAYFRRMGVGIALCRAIVDWAWREGAERVELEVRVSSQGAQALYRSLGFVEVGRRKNYYASPVEDALLMRLQRKAD